jgi:hypothetical protein
MKSEPSVELGKPSKAASDNVHPRLPCRGCGSDCKNYAICDGRPWRTLAPEASAESR